MPDINKFSPDKPFFPFFSKVNLSDVFIPSPDIPGVNNPLDYSRGNSAWDFLLKKSGRNPFEGLGIVPSGPAAVAEYNPNRKFTSEAASYEFGNLYRDLGFLIGRDNEDLYARNQSFGSKAANTVIRLLDKVGAYTLQGFGFLGGLAGLGNHYKDYSSGSNFADWIAGASDNALSVWAREFDDDVDNIYRPIYQDAKDRDKGFFKRMLTDGDFWAGEFVDGASFLASAYLTGNIGKVLDLGGKAVRGASALRGLNFADEAAALSAEGLSGVSGATNLSKAATLSESGSPLVANTFSPTAGNVVSGFTKEAGNFANARKINMGVSTLLNTASEALFEASYLKDDIATRLAAEKNPDGSSKYTPNQIKDISARAARNSFILNMIALPISNLWETKMFYGRSTPLSARNSTNNLIKRQAGLLSTSEIAKRTFGQKGLDYLKSSGEGVIKEGLWEENIQLAIERMNGDVENIDIGFLKNIGKVLNQYVNQTKDAFSGEDREASLNIGLGGLIGGGMGIRSRYSELKQLKKDIGSFNTQINALKTSAKDLYEKNPDGSIKLEDGEPVIDIKNVLSYMSSLNKTLSMSELADNLKTKNAPILQSIVENENFSRLVKAYADNGLVDDLISKMDDYKSYKSEDLMLLGLDTNKEATQAKIEGFKEKATEYKNIYDNVEKNFFVRMRNDDKYGTKARAMKDKLYYLSTRASHLNKVKSELDQQNQNTSSEIAAKYPVTDTDSTVDKLNELYSEYVSARNRVQQLSTAQNDLNSSRELPDSTSAKTTVLSDGLSLTEPRKRTKPKTEPEYKAVDEEELEDAYNKQTKAEKELSGFLEENKDIVKGIKRGADGRFRYETPERNRLSYDAALPRNQVISKDLEKSINATLNVFNRLSDIKYGERYFDQVYNSRKQVFSDAISGDDSTDVDENIDDPSPIPPTVDPGSPGTEEVGGTRFRSSEENKEDLEKLKREKESLESQEDVSLEDEVKIDELNKKIEELEKDEEKRDEDDADFRVSVSDNIAPENKELYKDIITDINKNKRKIVKTNEYYEIDGERYRKVSQLIGNIVPEHLRSGLQNALTAGYTIDEIVKTFFERNITQEFKDDIGKKISNEAYDKLIAQLEKIREQLRKDGVEVVATNVPVYDTVLKVAGEIDILAVDKKGNFKIYEVEARQSKIWSQIATKQGRGPAIYEMTQKQLSAYRNLFANQYGVLPNSISVMFPIDVKYDKEDPSGFIEKVNLKKEIRYTPTLVVSIKSNVFQPVRIGSKYDGYDMTSLFIRTFIPSSLAAEHAKFRYLLRHVSFDKIKNGLTLAVKEAEEGFQEKYRTQKRVLEGETVDGYSITKHGDLNLYSLVGNKEMKLSYDGQLLGYMSPYPTLAYKDADGKFRILDENTTVEDYKQSTGNSDSTFGEFKNIARAYKIAYNELVNRMVSSREIKGSFDVIKEKNYTQTEDNKYKPSEQLKFNQGDYFEPVRIIANEDLIELITIGSKVKKQLKGDKVIINEERRKKLEEKLGMNAIDANTKARDLAKQYRDKSVEKIIELGTPGKEVMLTNKEVQEMFDIQMSYGELDLVNVGQLRPDLKDLIVNGVVIGNNKFPTVVHMDENDNAHVLMERKTKNKASIRKYQELSSWADKNIQTLKNQYLYSQHHHSFFQ